MYIYVPVDQQVERHEDGTKVLVSSQLCRCDLVDQQVQNQKEGIKVPVSS